MLATLARGFRLFIVGYFATVSVTNFENSGEFRKSNPMVRASSKVRSAVQLFLGLAKHKQQGCTCATGAMNEVRPLFFLHDPIEFVDLLP